MDTIRMLWEKILIFDSITFALGNKSGTISIMCQLFELSYN